MRLLKGVDKNFWWNVARRCDHATFFHTPLWHQLAAETYRNYRDVTLGAEFENGTCAVLPLLETRRRVGLFRYLNSTFAGCYGGLIADDAVSLSEQQQLYEAVLRWNVGQLTVTGSPFANAQTGRDAFFKKSLDTTYILILDTNFDRVFSKFSQGHRRNTRKGRRLGVVTRVASTLQEYRNYFKIYEDSLRRWGENVTSRYPWSLFENGYRLAQEHPEHLRLWLAELDCKIIAGAWVFYWNRHVVYWHGASCEAYFKYKPANVLFADIIRNACEEQYNYFDFNPSGGHEGVSAFKRSFGAEVRSVPGFYYLGKGS
jgi:CelD/BcsL family acetyltransferase involved in cellulose biosynthesis